MRKIVWMMSVSLDGFVEGPDHDLRWHRVDEEVHDHFNEVLGAMSAFLDGRRTYEEMAAFWPTADADPDSTPAMAAFARIWRDMDKYVYSTTLDHAEGNTTVVPDVVAAEVEALKARPGGDMAIGGADLAATFLHLDLIDELRLYVNPVVLGAGTPMFPLAAAPVDFELAGTHAFTNGVVLLHHRRARP